VEELTMRRESVYRLIAAAAAALIAIGASLYTVNSPRRALAYSLLFSGAAALALLSALHYRRIGAFARSRSARYGLNAFLAIAAFASVAVIVQALSARHAVRYDLTRNQRFSLAAQTTAVLRDLSRDVDVTAFYKKGTPEETRAAVLLRQFAGESGRFRYEIVDPDQKPAKAKDMGVTSYGTAFAESAGRREKVQSLTEESLLNAVVMLDRGAVKVVCFVKGHGERDPKSERPLGYAIAAQALAREGYEVRALSLFDEPSVPEDCAALVIAGPKTDYIESEAAKISDYLSRGGSAVVMVDPQTELPNLEALLLRFRIRVRNDAVVDPFSRVFGGEYSVPVVTEYGDHPITRDFEIATFFPTARSIEIVGGGADGTDARVLARTGKSAWGETDLALIGKGQAVKDDADVPGPVAVAAVVERRSDGGTDGAARKSRLVVYGDSDFADNGAFRLSGNSDFFLNAMNFLTDEQVLIALRPTRGLGDRLFLTASQGRFIFLVSVVLVPLAVLGCGVFVWARNGRRG
jgi:ABC-type uncharacterized transport system involved in gliding motility auxiliary subunit